jgi:hypothetical protein
MKTAKMGRPVFKITRQSRQLVEQMIACGESQKRIATAIGCSDVTLRCRFARELASGAARRRAEAGKNCWADDATAKLIRVLLVAIW